MGENDLTALYRIANDDFLWKYKAKILRVVDGDTFDAIIDLGFNILIRRKVRLYGVNTPEIKGRSKKKGLEAKQRVIELVEGKDVVLLSCLYDDKYGRCLAKIVIPDGSGKDLGEYLISEGLGVEYYGEGEV